MKSGNTSSSTVYEYDTNGNQISETGSSTGTIEENSYDAGNQLTKSVVSQNGAAVLTQRNVYNGSGQRIRRDDHAV